MQLVPRVIVSSFTSVHLIRHTLQDSELLMQRFGDTYWFARRLQPERHFQPTFLQISRVITNKVVWFWRTVLWQAPR